MSRKTLTKELIINAPAANIWRVFTDPEVTRQMGGEYISEWHVGGSIGWKGLDGKIYTHGTILQFEPQKLLQHSLVNEKGADSSVITYEFLEVPYGESGSTQTTLHAREEFVGPLNEKAFKNAQDGWDVALSTVKKLAETM